MLIQFLFCFGVYVVLKLKWFIKFNTKYFCFFLSVLVTTSSFIVLSIQKLVSININTGFNQQFFSNYNQTNIFKNINFTNGQLTGTVYNNYNKKLNISFNYK